MKNTCEITNDRELLLTISPVIENAPYLLAKGEYPTKLLGNCHSGGSSNSSSGSNSHSGKIEKSYKKIV